MKYAKEWKAWMQRVGPSPKAVLSYVDWKKKIVRGDVANWKEDLARECKKVDRYLFRFRIQNCSNMNEAEPVLELCLQNCKTLYKICKKLQKKTGVPALDWYTGLVASHELHFTGSERRAVLEWRAGVRAMECPVCFESSGPWCFLHCGHEICQMCIRQMWGLDQMKGTMYNLLANMNTKGVRCPVCRFPRPCGHVELI